MAADPTASPSFDLGPLHGNQWHQYATSHIGQLYYVNRATGAWSLAIPQGYEDNPNDTWALDPSKSWPQWTNTRTGRSVLIDPNPPLTNTYLDDLGVKAGLVTIQRAPESHEHLYRIPMTGILQLAFPRSEGFSVIAETKSETTRPGMIVFKVWARPSETLFNYDYMVVGCKNNNHTIPNTELQLYEVVADTINDVKSVYGLIQCGLDFQFYKYENSQFQKLGGVMHIVNDAGDVQRMLEYVKAHPLWL
ncbi:hypothetical protein FQN55_002045 [Onygenales sp. PD_40]|nr:hypothetical protein FQN55_002045 [Onygenales sp. PD_40]KAK2792278.1 hypothetical protein FQN52_003755 [Onygenales sp. PD_12]